MGQKFSVRYGQHYPKIKKFSTLPEAARFWEQNLGAEVLDRTGQPIDADTLWDVLC
jgi:hypothetical protein